MTRRVVLLPLFLLSLLCASHGGNALRAQSATGPQANPPIYISFLWHMHQPIYWPYETVTQTEQNARYPYSVVDIFNQRIGPYTSWPGNAVQKGVAAGLPHFGAQVSFSGSLVENLNNLQAAGNGNFVNWKATWNSVKAETTSLGNPRLDMVGFGYHHPLMGLTEYDDTRRQIQAHKQIMAANFVGSYSKGIFPPENAFSLREIPALVDEGLQWVLVDNIHFDRACNGYPFSTAGNLYEPNPSDQRNPNPNDWIQLNGLWAPTQTSARWGRQPHYVRWTDPSTGAAKKMIAVPADRYMGNEDGRGGFGALNYEYVISQLEAYNTDPQHPILIVLHHDGDNYGGGTDSYYNSNFQTFVNWLLANPSRFVCSSVQDYLEMFPPDTNDVIHVEDGSWSGADNGDPEFLKWNGNPSGGYSPDRNSWGVVTAAKNIVETAQQIAPLSANTQNAWKFMLNAEASDYWYWDGSQNGIWDSHPTRASNQAVLYAQPVIAAGTDLTPPTIYLPQREPYNPGGTEWGINQPSNVTIWTYAFDASGLKSVTLRYRTSTGTAVTGANDLYTGGAGVGTWTDEPMTGTWIAPQTSPLPVVKALQYSAPIDSFSNVLVDYYVEAVDSNENVARSPIRHVWIGPSTSGGGGGGGGGTAEVAWSPLSPTTSDSITITVSGATQGALLHWGVNNNGSAWQQPNAVYWPAGSSLFNGTGPALQTPMAGPDTAGTLRVTLPPFNNGAQAVQTVAFVIHYNSNTWDNNGGQDYHITIGGSQPAETFLMDGQLDTTSFLLDSAQGLRLFVGWNGSDLYVATPSAPSQGGDLFLFVADSQRTAVAAPWAKGGQVAGWNAFLGNESTNNWAGWFNKTQGTLATACAKAAGTYLEGTINLAGLFGSIPPQVFLAAVRYQTADGGALAAQVPAGNSDANVDTSEFFRYHYTIPAVPPPAPVAVFPGNGSIDRPLALDLRWNRLFSATSYAVQLATDSTFAAGIVVSDTGLTDTARPVAGLSALTRYFWRVRASNSNGDGPFSAVRRFTTLPPLPVAPVIVAPVIGATGQPVALALVWDSVAHAARYELQLSSDSTFATILLQDTSILHAGKNVGSLTGATTYHWRVRAVNAAGKGPWSATGVFTTSDLASFSYRVARRWNLISLPFLPEHRGLAALFPGAVSSAFSYDGAAYALNDSLNPGTGYWVNFPDTATVAITGAPRRADTLSLATGWNLIGTIAETINVAGVATVPASALVSSFFGYEGSYAVTSLLLPGKGYWVKSDTAATLMLQPPAALPSSSAPEQRDDVFAITAIDAMGRQAKVYCSSDQVPEHNTIPPLPPAGSLDVRYSSSLLVERFDVRLPRRVAVLVRDAAYPLKFQWDNIPANLTLSFLIDRTSIPLSGTGSTIVTSESDIILSSFHERPIPRALELEQNFPNPFNPQTRVRYGVPSDGYVRLSLYSLLGEELARPVDGVQSAGYHEVTIDGSALATGVYLYKVTTTAGTSVRKMMILR